MVLLPQIRLPSVKVWSRHSENEHDRRMMAPSPASCCARLASAGSGNAYLSNQSVCEIQQSQNWALFLTDR
jgi:hypothetical protein